MKKLTALIFFFCMATLLALPAAAADVGITAPAENDDSMGVLLDGAPYMSFDASQQSVRFQVPEELRNVGPLRVYDYRSNIKLMINNVEDVTPDAEGYVEIQLPSTGEFCVAATPFEAYRLVLDLRYLDESLWEYAKTPDQPFDTDVYAIPPGDWVDSKTWREQQGLDPWPVVGETTPAEPEEEEPTEEDPGEEPDDPEGEEPAGEQQPGAEETSRPEGSSPGSEEEPGLPGQDSMGEGSQFSSIEEDEEAMSVVDRFPFDDGEPKPFPWGSYVVVVVSAALGVLLANLLRTKQ